MQVTELVLVVVVCARHCGHVMAVEQSWSVDERGLMDLLIEPALVCSGRADWSASDADEYM